MMGEQATVKVLVYFVIAAWVLLMIVLLASCEKKPATVTQVVEVPTATPAVHATATPQPTPETVVYRLVDVELRTEWTARLDKVISGIVRDKEKYLEVQQMRTSGVPYFITGGIHERESSRNFTKHLHEGSPLIHRTRYVPKNRLPPPKNPPYEWRDSAEDAFYILKREDKVDWNDEKAAIHAIIGFNGWGYAKYHPEVQSPYAYSGTTKYVRGKYVSDGRFDPLAVDKQAGVVAIWKRMIERGIL